MKRIWLILLSLVFLSGCSPSYRIENQAHAVTMGIDCMDGGMTVTVQVPNLGAPNGKEGDKVSSSYQIYSASAENFESAFSILEATLPQQMNLTHLKTVVFSKEFAQSDQFYETIQTFMNVFLVTGSANVIVTEKEAKTLIENQKPHIGIRLSITIPSMLSYHSQSGFIPVCTLSNLYAGLKGRYSTALCTLADTQNEREQNGIETGYLPGELPREGDNKNEYMGAAVFNRRKMVGSLNGREMQLCYFLMNGANRIADFASPIAMRVSTRKKRDVKIILDGEKTEVKLVLYLDIATLNEDMDLEKIEKSLIEDFEKIIKKCQDMKVEPFGFSETAAKKFRDNQAFENFDWITRFSKAKVELSIELNGES